MNQVTPLIAFGGSFDPPHLGHRAVAQELCRENPNSRILVIPSGHPPLKTKRTPSKNRLDMCQYNFEGLPLLELSPLEIEGDQQTPHYTYKTLEHLRKLSLSVTWVVGMDQWINLPQWKEFPNVIFLCHWMVLLRKGQPRDPDTIPWFQTVPKRTLSDKKTEIFDEGGRTTQVHFRETSAPEISSTRLRSLLEKKDPEAQLFLYPPVAEYIKKNQLYGPWTKTEKMKETHHP